MAGNTLAASTGRIVSGAASNIAFYIKICYNTVVKNKERKRNEKNKLL